MGKIFSNFRILVIVIIPIILVSIWFRDGRILGTAESGLPFYDLAYHSDLTKISWAEPPLGNPTGIITATAPTYYLLSKIEGLGIPGYLIEATSLAALWIVSGLFMYLLAKELFSRLSPKFLLLAVFLYWFNPLTAANVWSRFLYNHMFLWALLPVYMFFYIKGLKDRDIRYAIASAFSTVVFSYALSSLAFAVLLLGMSTFIFICVLFLKRNKRFYIVFFITTVLLFLLFNAWWISQIVSGGSLAAYLVGITKYFTSSGNVESLTFISQRLGEQAYIYRFLHKSLVEDGPAWARAFDNPLIMVSQFLLTGVILWAIFKFRSKVYVLIFGSLFILSLFFLKGNAPPLGEIFEAIFLKFTPLQVFRNPFEKLSFVTTLTAAPLLALGLSELEAKAKGMKKRFIYFICLIYIAAFLGFPFWVDQIFSGPKGYLKEESLSYKVDVPKYYFQTSEWLKKDSSDARSVVIPLGQEGINYSWEHPYQGVEISNVLFGTPGISFNTTIPFYSDFVTQMSKYQLSEKLFDFYPFINAKYLILRGDIDYQERKMTNPAVAAQNLDNWEEEDLVSQKAEFGDIKISQVNKDYIYGRFYSSANFIISNSSDIPNLTRFVSGFPKSKVVLVTPGNDRFDSFNNADVVLTPDSVFTPFITGSEGLDTLSDEDVLARLLYVAHLPGEWDYPLVSLKETLEVLAKSDYPSRFLLKTRLLGKRAVEIYKLRRMGSTTELISKEETEYAKELDSLGNEMVGAIGQRLANSSEIRDSLIYQFTLLARAGSGLTHNVSSFLVTSKLKPVFDLPKKPESYYRVYQFDIGRKGEYEFLLDRDLSPIVFIDGREYGSFFQKSNYRFELDTGFHEVALQLSQAQLFNDLLVEAGSRVTSEDGKSWHIDIPQYPSSYTAQFDYKIEKGNKFKIAFIQDIDKIQNPTFSEVISQDIKDWKHWEGSFTSTDGATQGTLTFLPTRVNYCTTTALFIRHCQEKEELFDVEIKNLEIRQINYPEMTLFLGKADGQESNLSQTSVEYEKLNPTEYKLKVNKVSPDSEIVVFSELYNPGWQLVGPNGEILENKHLLVNVYANGWVFDKPGSYNLKVIFAPQKSLEVGTSISIISILIALGFIGLLTWRRIS